MTLPSTPPVPTGASTPPATDRRGWVITALLVCLMLINFGDKAVLGLAADPMMDDLNLSANTYGLISSSFFALFSISSVVVGFVATRFRTKPILLLLALLWALAQAPVVFLAGAGTLLASRVVLGAAEGPANPLAINAAQKWFPDDKRNLPTSLVNLGAALGVVTFAPLLTYLIQHHGWRSAFATLMVLGLVWCALWQLFGREGDAAASARATRQTAASASGEALVAESPRVPYRRIFLSRTGIGIFIAGFVAYCNLAVLTSWVPLYLGKGLGLGTGRADHLIILPWLCGAVVITLQGVVTDRLMQRGHSSRAARVVLSACCILVSAVCMIGLTAVSGTGAKVALLTIAFSFSSVQIGVGMTLMAEITPIPQRSATLATVTGVIGIAGVVGTALTGLLVNAHGTRSPVGYDHGFEVIAALLVVGALWLLIFVQPRRDAARMTAQIAPPATAAVK